MLNTKLKHKESGGGGGVGGGGGEGAFCSTGLSPLFSRLLDSRSCQTARQISIAVCESRGGRPGLPVPNSPYGLCGRKATLKKNTVASDLRRCVKEKVDDVGSRPS